MSKFPVRYAYSQFWKLHKLLEAEKVTKARLSLVWQCSPQIATKKINRPMSLSLFELTALAMVLNMDVPSLIDLVYRDLFSKCATSFGEWVKDIESGKAHGSKAKDTWF